MDYLIRFEEKDKENNGVIRGSIVALSVIDFTFSIFFVCLSFAVATF